MTTATSRQTKDAQLHQRQTAQAALQTANARAGIVTITCADSRALTMIMTAMELLDTGAVKDWETAMTITIKDILETQKYATTTTMTATAQTMREMYAAEIILAIMGKQAAPA